MSVGGPGGDPRPGGGRRTHRAASLDLDRTRLHRISRGDVRLRLDRPDTPRPDRTHYRSSHSPRRASARRRRSRRRPVPTFTCGGAGFLHGFTVSRGAPGGAMNAAIATPMAAFAAGLATSLHCAGMCGPLACAVGTKPLRYHLSRLISYPLAGALCGALGQTVVAIFRSTPLRIAPWVMAIVLLGIALGLEKRIPQPRWTARLMLRARLRQNLG